MFNSLFAVALFADAAADKAAAAANGAKGATENTGSITDMLPLFVGIGVLFYLMVLRPQKNKDRDFKDLLSNLKKNERVVTIGGIHGVITQIQSDPDRVVIRIDEKTGATMAISKSAISKVVTKDKKTEDQK